MSVLFDKPKFINIIQYFLNNYCDMEAQVKALNDPLKNLLDGAKKTMRHDLIKNEDGNKSDFSNNAVSEHRKPGLPEYLSRPMRVYIADMIPNVMISDGHNLMEAIFTKESINDFRKNYSHYKFSSLKDKVIFLTKWSLCVEKVDSKVIFNSYNNLTIKIIVESFKPISHEHLTHNIHRHSPNVQSIFREEKIQNLVRCFRHWFSQQLIHQKCFTPLDVLAYDHSRMQVQDQIKLPSFKDVFLNAKKFDKDENRKLLDQENVGLKISNTQVFRLNNSTEDFINHKDLKTDSYEDMHQFDSEISKRHALQLKDMKVHNVTQLIIQEQGERFYSEQRDRKILKEMERIEDQFYREQLKNKLEYFQIGNQNEELQDFKHFEYLWQRNEQEKIDKKDKYHCQRKVVAYTFNFPIEKTRHQVVRMLNRGRYENDKKMSGLGSSPHKTGRPRANSQENILQLNEEGNQKSNLLDNGPRYSREPLSQFVCHKMKEINSDTQSEDSMGVEIQKQMLNEKNNVTNPTAKEKEPEDDFTYKLNEITNLVQPIQISLYQQYLDWFTDHELIRIKPQEINSQDNKGKESARPLESENTTKAESTVKHVLQDSPRFNIEMEEDNQPGDVQSENEEMTQSIRDSVNEDSEDMPDVVTPLFDKPTEHDVKVNAEESSKEEVVQQQIQDINMEISQEEQRFMNNLTIQPSPSEPSVSSQNELYNIKHEQPSSYDFNHGLGTIKQEETVTPKNENLLDDYYGTLVQKLQISTATNDVSTVEETMMNLQKVMLELQQRKLKIELEKERQRKEEEECRQRKEAERKRKEEEENLRKRREEEERKKKLMEEERIRKLEEERRERERLEKERLERERLERERLERERLEKERLERERLEKERLEREERERQEQERHQAEQKRIEHERQLRQQQDQAQKQEEQRQIQHRQMQMQVERQKRMVAERQRQERLKREQERKEREIEMEIQKYEAMIKQAEQIGKKEEIHVAPVVEEQEADWHDADADQEKPQSETLSAKESDDEKHKFEDIIPEESREIFSAKKQYVENMHQSLGSQIEKEIRQRAVQDLANRNFKSNQNRDRDLDMTFVCDQLKLSDKIQGIKIGDKLVPPANLQKKKTIQPLEEQEDAPLDNRYITSSQEQEMGQQTEQQEEIMESATTQQNQTQNDQIIIVSSETEKDADDVQVITAREMKKQFLNQKEHAFSQQYSQVNNDGALNQKVDQLTQLVAKLVNVISSQNAIKPQSQSEDEYHVPVFGSQPRDQANPQTMAVNQLLTEVQPFLSQINQPSSPVVQTEHPGKNRHDLKRNYSQMEQQSQAQNGNTNGDDSRPPNYSNLAQWCDEQRMVLHKKEIKTQYQERQRARSSSPMRQTNYNKANGQQLISDKDRTNMNAQIKRDDRMNVQKQYPTGRPMQVINRNPVNQSQQGQTQMRGGMNMTANKRYQVPSTQQQAKPVMNHQHVQHSDQAKRQRRSEEY